MKLNCHELLRSFAFKSKLRRYIAAFLTSYVLYGYLIPISLYVSLEFVKVFQAMVGRCRLDR